MASYLTMKIEGRTNSRKLQLLIDLGSTHNLLVVSIAEKLGCLTKHVPSLRVLVANGGRNGLESNVQGNYHMVLRVATLEYIFWNFRMLTMKF